MYTFEMQYYSHLFILLYLKFPKLSLYVLSVFFGGVSFFFFSQKKYNILIWRRLEFTY